MAGVAVKVTGFPVQEGLTEATMETLTGDSGLTVMVIGFDVAGLPVTHGRFDIISHVITSPFTGV